MVACPTCGSETETVRSIGAGGMQTEYICRKCNIAWYIDKDGKYKIRLSTTHTLASKLNDKDFDKLLKMIKEHSD